MKRSLFLILFFLITYSGFSQTFKFDHWESINYSSVAISNVTIDSTVIVATNRVLDTQAVGGRFLQNHINEEKKLRYFVSTKVKGKWVTFLQPSMDSALRFLPKDRNVVFFIHGDGKSFPILLKRCMDISSIYHVSVIAFDYPSLLPGKSSLRNFYNSRRNVKNSLENFSSFLNDAEKTSTKIPWLLNKQKTLFFHSLGNYLLREYTESKFYKKVSSPWADNLLLNSGAVKQRNHNKWLKKSDFSKRTYITSNRNDYTLKGAMLITFSKQLGGNIRRPLYKDAHYINFTPIADKEHNCFLNIKLLEGQNKLRYFYKNVLNGNKLDLSDTTKFIKRNDCLGYNLK